MSEREHRVPTQSMGHSEPDRIVVRGKDLCTELIGRVDFSSMFFLELTGRLPSEAENVLVNAVLVTLTEHGITANSLASRLTYLAAPSALQGAVAAGLLGAGEVFLGAIDFCAKYLQDLAAVPADARDAAIDEFVTGAFAAGHRIAGIGHPIHKPADPRVQVLFDLEREHLGATPHQDVVLRVHRRAEEHSGKVLPINADGAIAAILSDLGFGWQVCRGFAIVARSAGLVGHVHDEANSPTAAAVWHASDALIAYRDPEIRLS